MKFVPLRLLILDKLSKGGLPGDAMPRVWGGPGQGETCAACDEAITKLQMGMDGPSTDGADVHMHVACFYLWDQLRGAVEPERSASRAPVPGFYGTSPATS